MKKIALIAASLFIASTAHAADQSKAEQTAIFRVKVATCKAQAKEHGVKTASSEFYAYMGECVDRVNVAVDTTPAK
jgi:hypothetical protein